EALLARLGLGLRGLLGLFLRGDRGDPVVVGDRHEDRAVGGDVRAVTAVHPVERAGGRLLVDVLLAPRVAPALLQRHLVLVVHLLLGVLDRVLDRNAAGALVAVAGGVDRVGNRRVRRRLRRRVNGG